jgi:hypothetical protein
VQFFVDIVGILSVVGAYGSKISVMTFFNRRASRESAQKQRKIIRLATFP